MREKEDKEEIDGDDDQIIDLEIKNERGEVIETKKISKNEAKSIPYIMKAREKINEGKPHEALNFLMQSVFVAKGEKAVFEFLNQAKLEHKDKLGGLMGGDSKEEERKRKEREEKERLEKEQNIENLMNNESLLLERGREDILFHAMSDNSSVVCKHCDGLIKRERIQSHEKFWCPMLKKEGVDDEDDDD